MASVADYPPIPANVLQKRSLLQGYPGLHVYYDVPIQHLPHEAKLPGKLFKGMAAGFLFYAEKPKPVFRVAIGSNMDYSKKNPVFVEQGVYNGIVCFISYYPSDEVVEVKNYPVPDHGSYFWMQFLFTGDKDCQFYLGERHLGDRNNMVDNTISDRLVIWDITNINNCRILEMHFTCPINDGHKFFPMEAERWLCSRPAATLARGGSVIVTGRYKETNSAKPRIAFSLYYEDTGERSTWDYELDVPNDTSGIIEIIFRFRGSSLVCREGVLTWNTKLERPAVKSVRIRMVRNFEVENVEVSTGMNTWTSV